MNRKALLISPAYTLLDDESVRATPDDTWTGGLGRLLDRVAATMSGEGVVLLDQAAADRLKYPADLASATAAGWSTNDPAGWTTFTAEGKATVVVGNLAQIDRERAPVLCPYRWDQTSVQALALWHQLAGVAWRGTPGVAGIALLRATAPTIPVKGRATLPTWKPTVTGPEDAAERDFSVRSWSRLPSMAYEHGYDASRMYLAAAGTAETLCPWNLRHTGRIKFDIRRPVAGWFKVELSPWTHEMIPHPAGPGDQLVRWVTPPTLALLEQLAEQGVYGGFEVIDSWTGTGKRLLKGWAAKIEGIYQAAAQLAVEVDEEGPTARAQTADLVRRSAKAAYKEAWGLLNRPTNSIYWPYNHNAIRAEARCQLWRKAWRVGQTEKRWPLRIDVDNLWYESDDEDQAAAMPAGLTPGDRLGQFKHKGSRKVA